MRSGVAGDGVVSAEAEDEAGSEEVVVCEEGDDVVEPADERVSEGEGAWELAGEDASEGDGEAGFDSVAANSLPGSRAASSASFTVVSRETL